MIDRFRRCLAGTAFRDWNLIRQAKPGITQTVFKNCRFDLIAETIDDDPVEENAMYPKRAKKPREMRVKDWIKRMRLINSYLLLLVDNTAAMNETILIKEYIRPNFPANGRVNSKYRVAKGQLLSEK